MGRPERGCRIRHSRETVRAERSHFSLFMTRLRASDAEKRANTDFGPDFLESLARALSVVTTFDSKHARMTLSDIARAVDLPRATVRRTLYTLIKLGYMECEGKNFSLSPKILRLAVAYLGSSSASSVIQPVCETLCAQADEVCSAACLDDLEAVMIGYASPRRYGASQQSNIGLRLPAFCSAVGRILLAQLSDQDVKSCLERTTTEKLTPFTQTNKKALWREIVAAREAGFAFVDQEAEFGFRSIAVPLRRHDGRVMAALNFGVRIDRMTEKEMRSRLLPMLLEAASESSRLLV